MKKIILSMLLMLVCIPVFAANEETFYYDSERIEEMWITKINDEQTRSAHPYVIKRRSDNSYVYCLEAFVLLQNDTSYKYDNDYIKYGLSKEDIDRINLLIYYGYGYGNHTSDKWYGVTQYLIWKVTDSKADIYFTKEHNGQKAELYTSEINEIESLIKEHNTEPNFIKDYIISTNETLTIDSNIDLSNYDITSNADYKIKDNKLVFTNLEVSEYEVVLTKKNNRYKNNFMLYHSSNSQDVIIPGNSPNYEKEYKFKISSIEGKVTVDKKSSDNNKPLEGAIYGIYNNDELVKKITTDSSGSATTNLPFGNYILKEIEAPIGYELDTKVYEFVINQDNLDVNLELTDKKIYIEVKISKESTYNGKKLEGAVYGIYKDNELIEKVTTDNKGTASILLPFGKYILKEIEAPAGYKVDSNEYDFVIDEQHMQVEFNLTDDKIIIEVPDTGLKENGIGYSLIIIGIVGLVYGKKKYNLH